MSDLDALATLYIQEPGSGLGAERKDAVRPKGIRSISELCRPCQALLRMKELDKPIPHHPNEPALAAAAEAGCVYCASLLKCFDMAWKERLVDYPDQSLRAGCPFNAALIYRDETQCLMHQFRRPNEISKQRGDIEEIVNVLLVPVTDPQLGAVFHSTSNTGSQASFAAAKSWIQTCMKNHSGCRPKKAWFPSRAVDVGTVDEPRIRLHLKNSYSSAVSQPYLSLSHCWGQLQIKQLDSGNLKTMCDEILMDELPKTFQQAVEFTRVLGFRYLWIDSLCILQDSREDWIKESAEMENIYRYAACNIAATAAVDGDGGCFMKRDPSSAEILRLHIPSLPHENSPFGVYDIVPQRFWSRDIIDAPLNKRAWVLQEQFLSPRLIHCGSEQLLWECLELAACEMYPDGLSHPVLHDAYCFDFKWTQNKVDGNSLVPKTNDKVEQLSSGSRLWNRLVYEYKGRKLTKEQDMLVAISGVARAIQHEVQDRTREDKFGYLAGLWGQYLPTELLWLTYRHISRVKPSTRPQTYCAPSWSWASMNGSFGSFTQKLHPRHPFMIRIEDAQLNTVGPDQFGQVLGGHLKLTGWLHRFRCTEEEAARNYTARGSYILAFLSPDILTELRPDKDFYFLPVVEYLDHSTYAAAKTRLHGLMLEETGNGENEFRRLGHFMTSSGAFQFRRPTYPVDHVSSSLVSDSTAAESILEVDQDYKSFEMELSERSARLMRDWDRDVGVGKEWEERTITFV